MEIENIRQAFSLCKFWEDRYRLLIQLSRKLPKPSQEELTSFQEIQGCESRLWFKLADHPAQLQAYSDARLMQGLLFLLLADLAAHTPAQLATYQVEPLLTEFQLLQQLSSTRLQGLKQIEKRIQLNFAN
ncbi:hypothetical protein A4G20_10440 [Pasteurellaceae bacterium RH1A]|nr:hypothetical protein A4G20_10440 [Pasteurellaceae bacterium RH1A]